MKFLKNHQIRKIRQVEDSYYTNFVTSKNIKISKNVYRRVDENVPDKYDHNTFVCSKHTTKQEIDKAIEFQKKRGENFVKLFSRHPLPVNNFEREDCYAMLFKENSQKVQLGPDYQIQKPTLEEITPIEVEEYGPFWGNDFTKREIAECYNKVTYYGLYYKGELKSYCYIFQYKGYKMLDDLMTKKDSRHKGYATKLLLALADNKTFLHASVDDTPKDMYQKLGFKIMDQSYEYLKML